MRNSQFELPLAVFIISWKGMHENAASIASSVLAVTKNVHIVYSDPDPGLMPDAPCRLIRRSNDLFWEDKFKACLDVCGDGPLLVIHADCRCEDWSFLVKRCIEVSTMFGNVGVWAPKIDGTYYDLKVTRILKMKDSSLNIAALTDAIVFFLSADVVDRMRKVKFGNNLLGWGIDLLFCAHAHVANKMVLVDEGIRVSHPKERGYDSNSARLGLKNFLSQFSTRERVECDLLLAFVKLNYLKVREHSLVSR